MTSKQGTDLVISIIVQRPCCLNCRTTYLDFQTGDRPCYLNYCPTGLGFQTWDTGQILFFSIDNCIITQQGSSRLWQKLLPCIPKGGGVSPFWSDLSIDSFMKGFSFENHSKKFGLEADFSSEFGLWGDFSLKVISSAFLSSTTWNTKWEIGSWFCLIVQNHIIMEIRKRE